MNYLLMLALLLQFSCLEYQEVRLAQTTDLSQNFPPIIDSRYVRPAFTSLLAPVRIGIGCQADITFKIPPIFDHNREDRFYYLWFFDDKIVSPPSIIESEGRDSAIITLNLKRETLVQLLGAHFGPAFFELPHMVKFVVADRPYLIAENALLAKNALEDSVYWIVSFSDQPC